MRNLTEYRRHTRTQESAAFLAAATRMTGADLVAVRNQARVWAADRYRDGLRDGRLECLSSIWGLDPEAAETAQEIADLLPPLEPVVRPRLDRAPAEALRPRGGVTV